MKSKALFIACALTVATVSFNAYSQESGVCKDSLKTICTDTIASRAAREVYINNLKEEIST